MEVNTHTSTSLESEKETKTVFLNDDYNLLSYNDQCEASKRQKKN